VFFFLFFYLFPIILVVPDRDRGKGHSTFRNQTDSCNTVSKKFYLFSIILIVTDSDRGKGQSTFSNKTILIVTDTNITSNSTFTNRIGYNTVTNHTASSNCRTNYTSSYFCQINSHKMSVTPYRVVQGTFNQGDSRFGYSAGIQCSCNTIVSLCFSKFRVLTSWKTHDLDYILIEGDSNFKRLGFTETPFVEQFPKIVFIEGQECNIRFDVVDGEFTCNNTTINFVSEELLLSHCGVVIVIRGYSISIKFYLNEFFVFDSHSRDVVGKITPNGKCILMRFSSIKDIENYIRQTYCDQANTYSIYFQVLYVKITIENFQTKKDIILTAIRKRQKNEENAKYRLKLRGTEKHNIKKEGWKGTRKRIYESIKGTEKYDIEKEKMKATSKRLRVEKNNQLI